MRKIAESSHTGSDRILFYDIGADSGDARYSHIRVVHLQEWSDISCDGSMEKYNVVSHDVCIWGYDGASPTYAENCRNAYGEAKEARLGDSVRDSLRSCGFKIESNYMQVAGCEDMVRITNEYDGDVIAQGRMTDKTVALVIAEAMYGYGAGDRAHDESGNNARELLRSARGA